MAQRENTPELKRTVKLSDAHLHGRRPDVEHYRDRKARHHCSLLVLRLDSFDARQSHIEAKLNLTAIGRINACLYMLGDVNPHTRKIYY
jgi:hypothetical protein